MGTGLIRDVLLIFGATSRSLNHGLGLGEDGTRKSSICLLGMLHQSTSDPVPTLAPLSCGVTNQRELLLSPVPCASNRNSRCTEIRKSLSNSVSLPLPVPGRLALIGFEIRNGQKPFLNIIN